MEWTTHNLYSIAKNNNFEEYAFKSINEFKWCLYYGGEIQFEYNNVFYGICKLNNLYCLYEANKPDTVKKFSSIQDMLYFNIQNLRNLLMNTVFLINN